MVDHDRADAQTAIRRQAAQCHDVQSALVLGRLQTAADGADNDVIVISQLGQFAGFEHVDVELVVVRNGKDDRVERLQLLDVVLRHVAEFDAGPNWQPQISLLISSLIPNTLRQL